MWLTHTNSQNYAYKQYDGSEQESTPDASGNLKFREFSRRVQAGLTVYEGPGEFACASTDVHFTRVRNVNGYSHWRYCNGETRGITNTRSLDIAGQTMAGVVSRIRSYPLKTSQGHFSA